MIDLVISSFKIRSADLVWGILRHSWSNLGLDDFSLWIRLILSCGGGAAWVISSWWPSSSEFVKPEEAVCAEHNVAPDQQRSCLRDILQAPHHHLHYILKVPKEVIDQSIGLTFCLLAHRRRWDAAPWGRQTPFLQELYDNCMVPGRALEPADL